MTIDWRMLGVAISGIVLGWFLCETRIYLIVKRSKR
jgi:hypothetical protein